jgi:hypothetical protein
VNTRAEDDRKWNERCSSAHHRDRREKGLPGLPRPMRLATSFQGWVPINPITGKGSPNWKTALLVVLGLFSIVMLESGFSPQFFRRLVSTASLATFISNIISVAGTTFLRVPLFIRWFGWWLFTEKRPRSGSRQPASDFWALFFPSRSECSGFCCLGESQWPPVSECETSGLHWIRPGSPST